MNHVLVVGLLPALSSHAIGHAMQVITTFCRDVEKVGLCPMCLTAGQGLFERCEDIKDALDDAAAPTTSRVPDTAQGHVDAAVKQTQQAIRKGRLGAAHGHLASSAVGIQLKR